MVVFLFCRHVLETITEDGWEAFRLTVQTPQVSATLLPVLTLGVREDEGLRQLLALLNYFCCIYQALEKAHIF